MADQETEGALPRHIPDEWVAAWKKQTLEELMEKALRLEQHIATIQSDDSKRPMIVVANALESYIESRITERDIDLDAFL